MSDGGCVRLAHIQRCGSRQVATFQQNEVALNAESRSETTLQMTK
jgi:hypothetical protein